MGSIGKQSLVDREFGHLIGPGVVVQRRPITEPDDLRAFGPGKQSLIEREFAAPSTPHPVQHHPASVPTSPVAPETVHAAAAQGIATPASRLPYADAIQRAFGRHDVSSVRAHTGSEARVSARAMGADAYATGDHVVLGERVDLHTVAHEAAHVVQQRGGVQLKGGVGAKGDAYEQHADAVADRVVAGKSAEDLLDRNATGSGSPAVQRKDATEDAQILDQQAKLKNSDVEIPALEGAILATRLEAVKRGLLSQASFDASLQLSQAMTQLQPAVATNGPADNDVQNQAAIAAQRLFAAMHAETAGDKNFQIQPPIGETTAITSENPYTQEAKIESSFLVWSTTHNLGSWFQQLPSLIRQSQWADAFRGYRAMMDGLDLWVADQLRKTGKGTPEETAANAHQYRAQLLGGLEQIADKHAKRLPALFHPDADTVKSEKAAGRPVAGTVPMNVYFWKDKQDGKYHLYDLTTPGRPHEQVIDGQPTAAALATFFEDVARYPEGEVRFTLPSGAAGVAPTSGKTKWYEWFGYAGLAAASVGLALVTGGASVAATWCFAIGALAGGISTGGHLAETAQLGTATSLTVVIDVAQIVTSLASLGVAGITLKAGGATAALAGSRLFVPLLGTAAGADVVQLVAFTDLSIQELDKIQKGPGSPEDRQRAAAVLITQWLVTGGLTVLSVQGARNAHAFAGRPIEIIEQNGLKGVRLAGESNSEASATSTEKGPSAKARGPDKAAPDKTGTLEPHPQRGTTAEPVAPQTRRQALGTDPQRGYIDYEGTIGEEIESRFGGFDRDPSGAGEWIGTSGQYKGKSFDLLGIPPGKAQFHGPNMERFLPSVDAHFLKQIDYVILDTRSMTAVQKHAVMKYIQQRWAPEIGRLIVL